MSTWQIFSDAENNYRWEVNEDATTTVIPFHTPVIPIHTPPLPSMSDLLLQPSTLHQLFSPPALPQGEEHSIDNSYSFSNSLFKTASGRKVAISSNGLVRAKTLLGLDEEMVGNGSTFQSPKNGNKFCAVEQELPHLQLMDSCKTMSTSVSFQSPLVSKLKNDFENRVVQPCRGSAGAVKQAPIKFQTAGGRSISVSGDALQRARSLLGDPDLGDFFVGGGDSLFSFPNKRETDPVSSCEISECNTPARERSECCTPTPLIHQMTPESNHKHMTKNFTYPLKHSRQMEVLREETNKRETNGASSCERSDFNAPTPLVHQMTPESNHYQRTKSFTYPLHPSRQTEFSNKFRCEGNGNNLIMKFDDVGNESDCRRKSSDTCGQKPLYDRNEVPDSTVNHSSLNGFSSRMDSRGMPSGRALVDVSNTINNTIHTNIKPPASGKRRLGGLREFVSPFKKPRSSNIYVPGDRDIENFPNDLSQSSSGVSGCKRKVSTRYPFQYPRMHIKEFFAELPFDLEQKLHFCNPVRQVTAGNAEKYMFHDESGVNGLGAEAFVHLLAQHGASVHLASKEWVLNHYKWIVWKLACYERCYPARCAGNFLTVSNVLEELKYRYEREVNHGHRSTIKKILEGDSLPSSTMTLCISSIHSDHVLENGTFSETQTCNQIREAAKVELTDGWYSINATLDVPLSKQLAAGKLFAGQKLRIRGAGLCGWNGPVSLSPLEVSSTVSLLLHINGTYRANWAERLGFCKVGGPPLAFRCIKSNGGPIPQTLAGITRIYPILYRERLSSGRSVVISERTENKMMELHNERRSAVADSIISEYQNQNERRGLCIYDHSNSEGAKIYNMLETAAEPEFLMADMSAEQLSSFAAYKAKLNAIRQSEMESSIEKALKDAGLGRREVTPFMKLQVVGLTYKSRQDKPKEGIVTIWNPTEKQRRELLEGQAYAITGLKPSGSDSDILHLQTSGSSTKWFPLSSKATEQFKPFFSSRKSIPLSSFSDIPLSDEFDITALVVHVGDVSTSNQQKKQWVFVTDGSITHGSESEKLTDMLLAICFWSPLIDHNSFPPINHNLAGSTVGFCNLIKKGKDHTNHMWTADANENSTYYLKFDSPHCSHLRSTAGYVTRWARDSRLIIEKLKEKVLCIT